VDKYFVQCLRFYRAMHFSAKKGRALAKRGIAIACRLSVRPLSVRPSVCDVGGLWSHRLELFETRNTFYGTRYLSHCCVLFCIKTLFL